jgi:hypothetical protein
VGSQADIYEGLRPPRPTPPDEICTCPAGTPVKLMSAARLSFNPIHCLECNLEVPPERIGLDRELAADLAFWHWTYGAIGALELASGEYEAWARQELMNPESPANQHGLELARELGALVPTYFWFWQPEADEGWKPPSECPVCSGALTVYESGIFRQLLCERDRVVVAG